MTEYATRRIYPHSVPEFRHLQKADGTIEMQVRYINSAMGYTGKWMPVNTVQEEQKESA
jgi:trehalose-6-phosphate synthase